MRRVFGAVLAGITAYGLVALTGCAVPAGAPASTRAPAAAEPPAPQREEDPVRLIAGVTVRPRIRRAEVGATVCLDSGILEFLAVAPESGKEYESLLRLDCAPSGLHAALLALGARPCGPAAAGLARGGDPMDRLSEAPDLVTVSAQRAEAQRAEPVELWLIERSTGRPPERLRWVFTGSLFVRAPDGAEVYVADAERLAVALWYHAGCVLNLAEDAGSPYRGEHLGYEVNARTAPAAGTRVRVLFDVVAQRRGRTEEGNEKRGEEP